MQKFFQIVLACLLLISSSSYAASVSRSTFTTGIQDREPVNEVETFQTIVRLDITYFTELSGLSGHKVTHQWEYDGNVMYEKTFAVGSNRWRVWTSKTFVADWVGEWTVNVINDDKTVLSSETVLLQ